MDDCILFTGFLNPNGYGRRSLNNRSISAHRYAWIKAYGDIPTGMCVCHKCDVKACINPEHLFLGTHTDNMRDRTAKGRCNQAGSTNSSSKLTESDIPRIRERISNGETNKAIAFDYGVTPGVIWFIRKGKTWTHVPDMGQIIATATQ